MLAPYLTLPAHPVLITTQVAHQENLFPMEKTRQHPPVANWAEQKHPVVSSSQGRFITLVNPHPHNLMVNILFKMP